MQAVGAEHAAWFCFDDAKVYECPDDADLYERLRGMEPLVDTAEQLRTSKRKHSYFDHKATGLDLDDSGASNAFVVSGKHTESGHALPANDPHLALNVPNPFSAIHVAVHGGEKEAM